MLSLCCKKHTYKHLIGGEVILNWSECQKPCKTLKAGKIKDEPNNEYEVEISRCWVNIYALLALVVLVIVFALLALFSSFIFVE